MATHFACIGVGRIGASWALTFARAGFRVKVFDPQPGAVEDAMQEIARALANMRSAGAEIDGAALCARIEPAASLAEAAAQADYVQESGPENVEFKRAIFADLDRLAPPDSVLASSTSEIPASQFTEGLDGRTRCLVAHPFNPPHLIPVVEICPSPWTAPEVTDRAAALQRQAGQVPIRLQREIPGFILNRLQIAVVMEALHLLGEGICTVEDLDLGMQLGLALRWTAIGPMKANHLATRGGYRELIEKYGPTMRSIAGDLAMDYDLPPGLPGMIHDAIEEGLGAGGGRGDLERERDQRLVRLKAALDG